MHFFTADLHFFHYNIIKHCDRPFSSLEEMHNVLIDNWNDRISNSDSVYVLGDFFWGNNIDEAFEVVNSLKFNHLYLLHGNHDNERVLRLLEFDCKRIGRRITLLPPIVDMKINKQHITLCHYAMKTWNKSHHGAWQLFGHSHGTLCNTSLNQMDVGVDTNNFYPYSFDDIRNLLIERKHNEFRHN